MDLKKSLIATTAIVAVGGIGMMATTADAASKPKLKISGYYELFMGVGNGDHTGSTASGTPTYGGVHEGTFNILHYGEIRFKGEGKTDSGMKWGVYFEDVKNDAELQGKKVSTDEADIWLSGSWGKVTLGGQDGANDQVYYGAEKILHHSPGMIDAFVNTHGLADEKMSSEDTSDDSKITYYTPRISGFQAGYSWVPNSNRNSPASTTLGSCKGSNGCGPDSVSAHEASISYIGKIGPGKLKASFSGSYGTTANTGTKGSSSFKSEFSWRTGATYSQGPWSIAAGYRHHNNDGDQIGNDGDTKAWEVGAAYSGGRYEVALHYYHGTYQSSGGDIKMSHIGATGAYNLGGGLTLSASLWFYDLNGGNYNAWDNGDLVSTSISSTNGTVGIVAIGARF